MTTTEIVALHNKTVLEAYDEVTDGTPDMRMSLIWLLNLSESWIDQSRLENDTSEPLETA
jgi:hypothetical protein